MKKNKLLELAIIQATLAHTGQVDRGGQPYIFHCLRVMMAGDTMEEKIVGVLHDSIEDTDLTLNALKTLGFPDSVINAIDCITKRPGENYREYLLRVASNKIATLVKLKDLRENMNFKRLRKISPVDEARNEKYAIARDFLTHKIQYN